MAPIPFQRHDRDLEGASVGIEKSSQDLWVELQFWRMNSPLPPSSPLPPGPSSPLPPLSPVSPLGPEALPLPLLPDDPQIYRLSTGLTSKAWVFFLGGVAMVGVAALGFTVALRSHTSPLQMHLSTTAPTIVAVGLFATGYHFARSQREVAFGQEGLHVRYRGSEKLLSWDEIAWAQTQQSISNRKIFAIYGNGGKVVLKLPSNLEGFDELVAIVKQRLSDQPSPHASAVRWRKSRRTATALLVGAILAIGGSVGLAWMAYDAHQAKELMRTQGVDGEGIIARKFIAPDGRTHRIEYRVAGAGDNAKLHNVEIDTMYWTILPAGGRAARGRVSA